MIGEFQIGLPRGILTLQCGPCDLPPSPTPSVSQMNRKLSSSIFWGAEGGNQRWAQRPYRMRKGWTIARAPEQQWENFLPYSVPSFFLPIPEAEGMVHSQAGHWEEQQEFLHLWAPWGWASTWKMCYTFRMACIGKMQKLLASFSQPLSCIEKLLVFVFFLSLACFEKYIGTKFFLQLYQKQDNKPVFTSQCNFYRT